MNMSQMNLTNDEWASKDANEDATKKKKKTYLGIKC